MKTVGELIKDARENKELSVQKLEEITKIKSAFIIAIEKEKWKDLPTLPIVLGFVKNLCHTLDINENLAVAVLKRDYSLKPLNINPKPELSTKFSWDPKLTFIVGICIATIAIMSYLIFQYINFISPPKLRLESPKDNQIVVGKTVLVFGTTDKDVKLFVSNQPVLVDEDGKFLVNIGVIPETKEIIVKAISRSGKESVVSRKIVVQ